jgi:hypothetical protein
MRLFFVCVDGQGGGSLSCVLGRFLLLSASVFRQTVRYLPPHTSENASKKSFQISTRQFKTVFKLKAGKFQCGII